MNQNQARLIIAVIIILSIAGGLFFFRDEIFKRNNNPTQNPEQVAEEEGEYIPFFACPIDACSEAIPIVNRDTNFPEGVGFQNVSENASIYAVIDGEYTSISVGDETTVTLTDADGLEATYIFNGEGNDPGSVKKGDVVGTLGQGNVTIPESEQEFSIFMRVRDTRADNIIPLGPDTLPNSLKIL